MQRLKNKIKVKKIVAQAVFSCVALSVSPWVFSQARAPIAIPAQTLPGGSPEQTLPQEAAPVKVVPKGTVGTPEAPRPPVLDEKIEIKSIQLEGVKSLDFKTASGLLAPLANKPIVVGDLVAACDSLTKLYQAHGYALSFCFIPQQDFSQGVARVVAVEGRASKLTIVGDPGKLRGRVEALARPALAEAPLTKATFERMAALLSAIPGLTAVATIDPPTQTNGESELKVEIKDKKRFDFNAGLDFNHPGFQALMSAVENGQLGLGEQITLSAIAPPGQQEQKYYAGKWVQPVGSDGMSLLFNASSYRAQPTNPSNLPSYLQSVQSQDKVSGELSYPFKLSQTESLVGAAGAYVARESSALQNTITGLEAGQRESVRVATARLTWAKSTDTTLNGAEFQIAKGVQALGAHKEGFSNFGADIADLTDLSFWKLGLTASRTQQWASGWGYQIAMAGQWSPNALPSAEQIAFGSTRFGLGYEAGATSGDSGLAGSAQVFHAFNLGSKWLKTASPYLAADMGRVWLKNGQAAPSKIASLGIGARLTDGKHYNLDISLAKPVGQAPGDDNGNRPLRVNALFSYNFQ